MYGKAIWSNLVSNETNQFVTQYFDWTLNKFVALTIHQQYLGQSLKLLSNLSNWISQRPSLSERKQSEKLKMWMFAHQSVI